MRKYHFTVTSVTRNRRNSARMWSVSKSLKQAKYLAEHNADYMCEHEYEYIVIEKYEYDMGSMLSEQVQWYRNNGSHVIEIEQPEFAKGLCNFAYH